MNNHMLFRRVVSNAVKFFISDAEYRRIHKCPKVHRVCNYLPFSERRELCAELGIQYTDFINHGISGTPTLTRDEIDTIYNYEQGDSYKALLGFGYLYRCAAKGTISYIAKAVKVNEHYVRQLLSEYTVISNALLRRIAVIYGISTDSVITIGDMLLREYSAKEIYAFYKASLLYEPVIHITPYVDNVDYPSHIASSIMLGLAVNRYMTDNNLWVHKRPAKLFGISDLVFYKILYFRDNTDYTSTYDLHLTIAEHINIKPLSALYDLGVSEYTNYVNGRVVGTRVKRVEAKASIIDNKRVSVSFIHDIIGASNKRYTKAIISEFVGLDQSHLSRGAKGILPSSELINAVLDAFGVTQEEVIAAYTSANKASEIRKLITSILVGDCKINKYLDIAHKKEVAVCNNVGAVLSFIQNTYGNSGITKWLKLANIGRSCIKNVSINNNCQISTRTLNMLSSALRTDVQTLNTIGEFILQDKALTSEQLSLLNSVK